MKFLDFLLKILTLFFKITSENWFWSNVSLGWKSVNYPISVFNTLEPKQFKNNLIMFKDKPQFEFCRLLAGSNFEVDAQKNQNDV